MHSQRGVSILGLVIILIVLIMGALLGMRTGPAYMEFFAAKKLAKQIVSENPSASVADVRRAWDLRQGIQDITSVSAKDIEVVKEGNQTVISFAYRKEVPLVGNTGLYMDFRASTSE